MYRELRHSLTNHITEILAIATSMKRKHIADAGNAFRVVSKVSDFIEKYEKLKVIYRELSKDLEQKAHLEKRDYIKLAMVVQSTVDLKKDLAILYAMTLTVLEVHACFISPTYPRTPLPLPYAPDLLLLPNRPQ